MFDYHMHSRVSFDGQDTGEALARAAAAAGLKEICFTDHLDYEGERLCEYNGQRYSVLRTFRTGQELEIVVARASAEEGGVYE